MICYDVSINDEHICRAGVGDDGVLVATVDWVDSPKALRERHNRESNRKVDVNVSGLRCDTHVDWLSGYGRLQIGDTVTIRIIEADNPDQPAESHTSQQFHEQQCGFCGLTESEERRLLATPLSSICSECVVVAQLYFAD